MRTLRRRGSGVLTTAGAPLPELAFPLRHSPSLAVTSATGTSKATKEQGFVWLVMAQAAGTAEGRVPRRMSAGLWLSPPDPPRRPHDLCPRPLPPAPDLLLTASLLVSMTTIPEIEREGKAGWRLAQEPAPGSGSSPLPGHLACCAATPLPRGSALPLPGGCSSRAPTSSGWVSPPRGPVSLAQWGGGGKVTLRGVRVQGPWWPYEEGGTVWVGGCGPAGLNTVGRSQRQPALC